MPKEYLVYLQDILDAIIKIEKYTKQLSFEEFKENTLVSDAVMRNLEIIGEATKKISKEIRDDYNEVEWKKIAGLRDILIHAYSGIDFDIIWDIVKNKLPILKSSINKIIKTIN